MNRHFHWIKLEIHPLSLIYYLLALFTGYFKWYLISMIIVLIHEYHHALIACFFHFKINRIVLMPFGAFIDIEDYGHHPLFQELLVVLGGLLSHITIYFLLKFFYYYGLSEVSYQYALSMNQMILLFNLLPIWPMDGSKIIEILLFYVLDYQKVLKLNLYISLLFLIYMVVFHFKMNHVMIYLFLAYHFIKAMKESKYRYLRYLLKEDEIKRLKVYHHKLKFYRPYQNFLLLKGRCLKEKEMKSLALKLGDKNVDFL